MIATTVTAVPSSTPVTVTVCGWVDTRRVHSEHLAFIDLRDHTGIVQCVVDEKLDLRSEYVAAITGVVRARLEGATNEALATGETWLLPAVMGDYRVSSTGESISFVSLTDGYRR